MTYRQGERVRIVTPRVFVRCGYPISIQDLRKRIGKEYAAEIEALIVRVVGTPNHSPGTPLLDPSRSLWYSSREKVHTPIINALAYAVAKRANFGGNRREVHTREFPALKGMVLSVGRTFRVVTGEYHPGDREQPAWLTHRRHHTIIEAEHFSYPELDLSEGLFNPLRVEAACVGRVV
jgi:hypothetical protein